MRVTILPRDLVEPGDLQEKKPASKFPLQRRLQARLMLALSGGGWWCNDCEHSTEHVDGEQGQPDSCSRCGSHRITYQPPA